MKSWTILQLTAAAEKMPARELVAALSRILSCEVLVPGDQALPGYALAAHRDDVRYAALAVTSLAVGPMRDRAGALRLVSDRDARAMLRVPQRRPQRHRRGATLCCTEGAYRGLHCTVVRDAGGGTLVVEIALQTHTLTKQIDRSAVRPLTTEEM